LKPVKRSLPDLGRKGWRPDEQRALFKAAAQLGVLPLAAIRWTYETASRLTEVVHLTWESIDWAERSVSIVRLKGSHPVLVRFSPEMEALLKALKPKPKGLVFRGESRCYERPSIAKKQKRPVAMELCPGSHLGQPQIYRWFVLAGAAAGLHRGLSHPHAAKHSRLYAMSAALRNKGLGFEEILKRLMLVGGHATKENVLIYLEPVEQAKDIAADLSVGLDDL
jgi:integrase